MLCEAMRLADCWCSFHFPSSLVLLCRLDRSPVFQSETTQHGFPNSPTSLVPTTNTLCHLYPEFNSLRDGHVLVSRRFVHHRHRIGTFPTNFWAMTLEERSHRTPNAVIARSAMRWFVCRGHCLYRILHGRAPRDSLVCAPSGVPRTAAGTSAPVAVCEPPSDSSRYTLPLGLSQSSPQLSPPLPSTLSRFMASIIPSVSRKPHSTNAHSHSRRAEAPQ